MYCLLKRLEPKQLFSLFNLKIVNHFFCYIPFFIFNKMLFSNYFFYSDVSNFGAVLQTLFKNQLPPSNLSSRNQISLCNLKSYSQKELDLNYSYFFFEIFLKYIQQKSNKQLFCFFKKESIQSNILLSDLITYLVDRFKKFQTKIGKGFFLAEFFESLF